MKIFKGETTVTDPTVIGKPPLRLERQQCRSFFFEINMNVYAVAK